MKNKFLEAFYSMEDEEVTKQLGTFLDVVKINIKGVELTPKGIDSVLEHIKRIESQIKPEDVNVNEVGN